MMHHVTQPIDDLINLPYTDIQLDLGSFTKRILLFIRRKWFKSKKWLRVPVFLRTPYTFSHVVLFVQASHEILFSHSPSEPYYSPQSN